MWVEAILSKDDLAAAIRDACPVTVVLDPDSDDHYVRLLNPRGVELVPERGLRLSCEADIRWPVLGIDVPIRVESLTAMLNVGLTSNAGEEALAFTPELEDLDLSWVPNLVDRAIADKINQQLRDKQVGLSWRFANTLSHVFDLPDSLREVSALDLRVAWGKVRVTNEAMVLAVSFHTHVVRDGQAPSAALPVRPTASAARAAHALTPREAPAVMVPVPIAIAGAAAMAGVAGYVALEVTGRLWRYLARA